MNKFWIGSIYYFLNVILHFGVLGILVFVNVPDDVTTLNYITEFWAEPEGRELVIVNSSLLLANFIFAFSIIYLAPRSDTLLIMMAAIAWIGLILAYYVGTVGLVAYAAGAIHLSAFSFNKLKASRLS